VNDEHAMMRFEFLEAIVRLGEPCWAAGCCVGLCGLHQYPHVPARFLPLACCCLTRTLPSTQPVCAALAKYGKGQATDDLGMAVELLFERNLLPRLPPQAQLDTNEFRTERLYAEEVRRQPANAALYCKI
jgi:hypothetical protein